MECEEGSEFLFPSGECTSFLSKHNDVIGIDISKEMITICQSKYPHLTFQALDVLIDPLSFLSLFHSHHCSTLFVDIGGNRAGHTLVCFLEFLMSSVASKLIVVKCEELVDLLGSPVQLTSDQSELQTIPSPSSSSSSLPLSNGNCCVQLQNLAASLRREREAEILRNGKKRFRHPLRYPLHLSPSGVPICRYHNYSTCKRRRLSETSDDNSTRHESCLPQEISSSSCTSSSSSSSSSSGSLLPSQGSGCPLDHAHCHHCGQDGHKAMECKALFII